MITKLEKIPFPIVITNDSSIIIECNTEAKASFPTLKYGESFNNVLIQESQLKNISLVSYQNNYYMMIKEKITEEQLMNIIVAGESFYELQQKVKELDKANKELDAIIETSYDGIYITDKNGNTLRTNSAIERITGIPKHYYIGKNIKNLMKRGILRESVSEKVMKTKGTVSVVQKNFNQKETLLTGSPIFNEDGEIEKIVTNIRDLSELNQLHSELSKAQELSKKYKRELEKLKAFTKQSDDVVLKSEKMIEIFSIAERLANVETTVLILGETGVGKDVFARQLYRASDRFDDGKFIKINCGAIPKDLLESELFGYEGGAFSGANRTGKEGMFELANHGVLFLDEVGELSLDLQVKLLRVLQEKEIQRIGGTTTRKVNVRVIAATNRNLKAMVKEGTFREDLYYRLHVVPVLIPPLRDRRDDILPLIQFFMDQCNKKYKISKNIDRHLKEYFYHYDWPGNVRELSNLIERLMLTVPATVLTVEDLPEEYVNSQLIKKKSTELKSLKAAVEDAEKETLLLALERWKTTYDIAKHLDTSQATIVRKLKKYNLSTYS